MDLAAEAGLAWAVGMEESSAISCISLIRVAFAAWRTSFVVEVQIVNISQEQKHIDAKQCFSESLKPNSKNYIV